MSELQRVPMAYTVLRRRCHGCKQSRMMQGGSTQPGGRVWLCRDCKAKRGPA